ncbi:MAG TPA: S1 RNA-binding domain-containing protein [Actinomycetota bacterium]|nr:S1 RNA-binding domain-containing protein [Actinomycetota bacterium]
MPASATRRSRTTASAGSSLSSHRPVDAPTGGWDSRDAAHGEPPCCRKGADISDLEVGAVVEGTVQRITPYGAFLQLDGGQIGLVHISEIDRNYVRDVREHLRENDRVQAKVVAIKEDGKIDLSIKALQDPAPRLERRGKDPGFESMLKKFMRQSEERQVDFKRSLDHKRR